MVNSGKKQKYLILLLLAILAFFITVFRQNIFWNSNFGALMYMLLVSVSIFGIVFYFTKLIGLKPIYLISFFVVLEILLSLGFYAAPAFLKKMENHFGGRRRDILLPIAKVYDFYASYTYGSRFNVFQYDNGEYNSSLFYKLIPGQHQFGNVEFNNLYNINSQGFRDKESDLKEPKIILLGDSFSLGIGVNENETYAQIIESKVGKSLLNTGVPSYGTAREYLQFKTLQKDSTKLLLLQYCNNDLTENVEFLKEKNDFIGSNSKFNTAYYSNITKKYYFPFKYLNSIFEKWCFKGIEKISKTKSPKDLDDNHGKNFVQILKKIQNEFKGNIIVFSLDLSPDSTIFNGLKKEILANKMDKVYTVNVLKNLKPTPQDFYHFDGHINNTGHQKVANEIIHCIKENKLLE